MVLTAGRYVGPLYRALNPVYARAPLSGRGAERYGGRFNAKGLPALYMSLAPTTALREANQVGGLQPTVLVRYRADLGPVFDGRDGDALAEYAIGEAGLADPVWRARMLDGAPVPTQEFAGRLLAKGYVGLLVPSYAKGARATADWNMVLWRWSGGGCQLEVVDDEDRLGRM